MWPESIVETGAMFLLIVSLWNGGQILKVTVRKESWGSTDYNQSGINCFTYLLVTLMLPIGYDNPSLSKILARQLLHLLSQHHPCPLSLSSPSGGLDQCPDQRAVPSPHPQLSKPTQQQQQQLQPSRPATKDGCSPGPGPTRPEYRTTSARGCSRSVWGSWQECSCILLASHWSIKKCQHFGRHSA